MISTDSKVRLLRQPFEPVRICSNIGNAYELIAPYLVALLKSKVFIASPNSDHWVELSYLHIALLEAISVATKGNAKRSRKS